MLDALVRHLVQEIGLQGTVGIHPNQIAGLAQTYFDQQAASLLKASPSSTTRRRSAGQYTQVLDAAYINYLLGVLLEHDDVLLVVAQPEGDAPAVGAERHTISRERYAEVGLPALEHEYGARLAIQLEQDAACLIIAGQRREYLTFSDVTLSILSTISSRGASGMDASELSKLSRLAPKDLFYHTKKLVQEQLVIKMNVTSAGLHMTHFTHRRFVSRSDGVQLVAQQTSKGETSQSEIPRNLLRQLELMEPRAMAVFDAQPKGVLRTSQLWGKDGWFLRQMGYRGRIDEPVLKGIKSLLRILTAHGKLRRINIRNTTARKPLKGLIPAYQSVSHAGEGEDSSAEVSVPAEELGLAAEESVLEDGGERKPVVDDGTSETAVVLYDPMQAEPEAPPSRYVPTKSVQSSTTLDYQILQFIVDGGLHGRTYKDVMDRFTYSRRFVEWLGERWAVQEGAPAHLPQTNIVRVTQQEGKEAHLVLFSVHNYRALCQQIGASVDPAICPPHDPDAAGGFLSLHEFELWDEPQQRVEWAESYPIASFKRATLAPRDLLPFLPAQADGQRFKKGSLSTLLGGSDHPEFKPRGRGKGKRNPVGPQKKQVARIERIMAGEEEVPSSSVDYRLLSGRAAAIGLTLPPRPTLNKKRGRSSSVASSTAASAGPALKKRARSIMPDGELDAVASTSQEAPPRKARRKSTLSQVVVADMPSGPSMPCAAAEGSPASIASGSAESAAFLPSAHSTPAGVIDEQQATLSETEGRPRETRRTKSTLGRGSSVSKMSLPAPPAAPLPPLAPELPSAHGSHESAASTEDLILVEPRSQPVGALDPQTPSQATRTPVSRSQKRPKVPRMPQSDTAQSTPAATQSAKKRASGKMSVAPDSPEAAIKPIDGLAPAEPAGDDLLSSLLAVPGPSAATVALSPLSSIVSPDYTVAGPAPPAEDARARLRRKQQEAEAAKQARRKQRREREVVEMDLGVNITRNHEQIQPGQEKPPRKERSDKGKLRGTRDKEAGRWIFPSDDRKLERQRKAAKKASAAGAATADELAAAAAKPAEAPPPPPVEHSYLPLTPGDDDLIPDIVNQVGRIPGSDAQRHRTRHNDELDDVIMDIGAIVCVRGSAPGFMYSWKPALNVIRGVTTTTVRNRFHKLQETRGSYIYQLESAYLRMWNAVGATPLLPDPKAKNGDFDLAHHLKFFRKNIDKDLLRANADIVQVEGEQEKRVPELPGHVGAMVAIKLEDNPNVAADAFDFSWLHVHKQNLSDDQSELASRNNLFLIEPSVSEPITTDAGRREDNVLASTVKMVCSTRDEEFDPRQADEVLPKTGRPGEVIKQLIAEGVCESRTDNANGRIGFSEQFVKFSAGIHPTSFFTEAAEVAGTIVDGKLLIEEEHSLWPLLASDGHTAALLYFSSENRVELETEQEDLEALCAGPNLRNSKKLDDEQLEFHISARLTGAGPREPVKVDVPPSFDLDQGPIALDVEARQAVLASLADADAFGLMAIGKRIVEYLDLAEVGGDGATWAVIAALCPELAQLELVSLVLELADTTPPLLFVTGYDRPRLVSTLYIPSWVAFVPTSAGPAPATSEDAAAPPAEVRKVMVWPRRWVDVHAHVNEKDWGDCVRLVVGYLLDRSGITEALLRQLLSPVLDRLEMSEVLRYLLQLRIARRKPYPASSLSPNAPSVDDLAEWPVGWLDLNEEKRMGWELVGGAWIEGLDDQS